MEIRCVVFDEKQLEQLITGGWIPESLDITLQECCFFGGVDEQNQMRAIAIYSYSWLSRKDMKLEYVFVQAKWRRQGIGSRLLRLAEGQLQLMGMRKLFCEWYDTEPNMEIVSGCLKKARYTLTMDQAHVFAYTQGDFQGSELDKLKDSNLKMWESVIQIDDYHDRNLRKFLLEHETTGFYIKESDFRPELCRFYMEDGEIKGAACMRFRKDGSLMTMKGYLSPKLKNRYAMTLLIASLISNLRTKLQPGIKIYIKIYRQSFYESVKKLFGEGQEQYVLQEYERVIGGK